MEELSGFMASFEHATVRHNDVTYVSSVRADLIELTVRHRKLTNLELLVGGYDDDPRSLYEVPEVRRWIGTINTRWPDLLFWLTPGSLWVVLLCLNPQMHRRLPDGSLEIALDPDELIEQMAQSVLAGSEVLSDAGLAAQPLDDIANRAITNFHQVFQRRQLGDYVVIHPDSNQIVTFRSDIRPDRPMEEST